MTDAAKHIEDVVVPVTSILKECVIKLQLLKLICDPSTGYETFDLLLSDETDETDENVSESESESEKKIISEIYQLIQEYNQIMNNPDFGILKIEDEEQTADAFDSLSNIKRNIDNKFHTMYLQVLVQCIHNTKHSKALDSGILQILKNDFELNNEKETENHQWQWQWQWQLITNSFVEYIQLRHSMFQELRQNAAESVVDTIRKYEAGHSSLRHEFEERRLRLLAKQHSRSDAINDMQLNLRDLTNTKQELQREHEKIELELNSYKHDHKEEQMRYHGENVKSLLSQIDTQTQKFAETKQTNQDQTLEIKKKVKRFENEIQDYVNSCGKQLIQIDEQICNYKKLHKCEQERLQALHLKSDQLVLAREEHERLLEEQRKIEEELKQKCEQAATKIQALWRGHRTRKQTLDSKAKSKKVKGDTKTKGKK